MLPALLCASLIVAAPQVSETPADKAERLYLQGNELLDDGQFSESEAPLLESIKLWSQLGAAREFELMAAQNSLGTAYRRRGAAEKAVAQFEGLIRRVDASKSKHPGLRDLRRVVLNNLATAYLKVERFADARASWLRAISLAPKGAPDEELARELDNLATLLLDSGGDLDEAERYLKRSNAAWLVLRGKDDLDYAISLGALGTLQLRRSDLQNARKNLSETLRIRLKVDGPSHPDVGGVLNLLGELEYHAGNNERAMQHFRRSIELGEKSLDSNHPQLRQARDGLAQVMREAK